MHCQNNAPQGGKERVWNQKWFVLSSYFCCLGYRHLRGMYLLMTSLWERGNEQYSGNVEWERAT